MIEARFDQGDELIATGEWSEDHHWIEVSGGETGTVWVYIDYVTEELEPCRMVNERFNSVKIRTRPIDGKVIGYIRKGRGVEITQSVLGWGRCRKGWVDLTYLEDDSE